jgi:hypothetical protein
MFITEIWVLCNLGLYRQPLSITPYQHHYCTTIRNAILHARYNAACGTDEKSLCEHNTMLGAHSAIVPPYPPLVLIEAKP